MVKEESIVGPARRRLPKNHLPSKKEVLAHFKYEHFVLKNTVAKSCNTVANAIFECWTVAGFFPMAEKNIHRSLKKLITKWNLIKKRQSSSAGSCEFRESLYELFDVGSYEMENRLDGNHLLKWRQQKGSRFPIPLDLSKRVKHSKARAKKSVETLEIETQQESIEEEKNDAYERCADDSDFEVKPEKKKRVNILTDVVVQNLDREKVSNRGSVGLLGATASALGHELAQVSLSRSTSQRKRKQARKRTAETIKTSFKTSGAVVVHFDSKKLIENRRKREKLAVVVTGSGIPEQVLSCQFIDHGTGRAVAQEVVRCLKKWGLDQQIKAKSYDTTSVNSGEYNGAAVIIDQLLGRKLLEFPCRHHVYELVLSAAYRTSFQVKTSSPDDTLFKLFREQWNNLDQSCFDNLDEDSMEIDERTRLIEIFNVLLEKPYHREDYAEFIQLGLMCLSPSIRFKLRPPGAMHHARWMAKGIYCLKMFLFRNQFTGEGEYQIHLKKFVLFVLRVYIEAWYTAPLATAAPKNDLQFLKKVSNYDDPEIRKAVLNKMKNHLWYLSEANIALAFFDGSLCDEIKKKMVKQLGCRKKNKKNLIRARNYNSKNDLSSFVTSNTWKFFEIMEIQTSFLYEDPSTWNENEDFKMGRQLCEEINVTNDCAERAIGLCSSYNNVGPKNDQEKTELVIGVAHNRRNQLNSIKSSVAAYVKRQ